MDGYRCPRVQILAQWKLLAFIANDMLQIGRILFVLALFTILGKFLFGETILPNLVTVSFFDFDVTVRRIGAI